MRAQPSPMTPDDRLLAPTRWAAIAITPILFAAFVVLYLFPGSTMRLWGWMICVKMTAIFMGSGYLAGAYFFGRVALTREWHRVGAGIAAVTVFASMLLATTVLHWDMFNHDHVSFWAWLALYVATPLLLPVLWMRNRRTDPRRAVLVDAVVPRQMRLAVGSFGAVVWAFAAVMFVAPESVVTRWPWALDPMTARTLSAFIAFAAITWLWFFVDSRWSSLRILQQTTTVAMVVILAGAIRYGESLRPGWRAAYLTVLVAAIGANLILYGSMERRAHRRSRGRLLRDTSGFELAECAERLAGEELVDATTGAAGQVHSGGRSSSDGAGREFRDGISRGLSRLGV